MLWEDFMPNSLGSFPPLQMYMGWVSEEEEEGTSGPVDEWKAGQVEEWKNGGVRGWECGRVGDWENGRVEEWESEGVREWEGEMGEWGWMSGRVEEWKNGQVDEWTGGEVEKWMRMIEEMRANKRTNRWMDGRRRENYIWYHLKQLEHLVPLEDLNLVVCHMQIHNSNQRTIMRPPTHDQINDLIG